MSDEKAKAKMLIAKFRVKSTNQKNDDGTPKGYWKECGVAFVNKGQHGTSVNIVLNAIPCAEDGQVKITLFEPEEKRPNFPPKMQEAKGAPQSDLDF